MTSRAGSELGDWLSRVRAEYWERLGALEPDNGARGALHVLFRLGPQHFAVDATLCRGVVRKSRVARLPGVPAHVLGVTGIRGEVISVTDPSILLDLRAPHLDRQPDGGYFLILASRSLRTAAWVDWVYDVVPVEREQVLPLDRPWGGAPEGTIAGHWRGREPPVLLLDGRRYLELSAVHAEARGES